VRTAGVRQPTAAWVRGLWAAGVLATALVLRVGWSTALQHRVPHAPYFFPPRLPHQPSEREVLLEGASLSDSHAYESLALNMLQHGVYTWQEHPPYRPTAYVTPGYPLFVAAVYAVLGRNPYNVVRVQLVLSVLTVGLLFFYAERRWGLAIAVPASLLLSFDPVSIAFSGVLMGETLGAALFLSAMLLYLEVLEKPQWWRISLAGLLLGMTALVRAATLYVVVVLLLPLLSARAVVFSKRVLLSAVLLAGFLVPVGAWMSRNRMVTTRFHFAGITGYNLLYTNAASLVAWRERISLLEARGRIARRFRAELAPLADDPVALSRKDGEIGKRIILADPVRYAALHAAGGLATLLATRSEDVAGLVLGVQRTQVSFFRALLSRGPRAAVRVLCNRGWLVALSFIEVFVLLALYVLFAVGVLRSRWRRDWLAVLLVVAYTAVLVGPVADSRFRVVFMPLLYLFAIMAAVALKRGARSQPPSRTQNT